jgi:uncharacterized protein
VRRALALAAAALLLAGCGGSDDDGRQAERPRETLTVTTGVPGGIYAVYGERFARAITRRLDGYRGQPLQTTGSVDNLRRLADGQAQIALTLADSALDAVEGREAFESPVPLKALAQIYPSYIQLVTRQSGPIRSVEDLAGKRVSVGAPDSGTQVVADRVLDVAGVNPRRRQLGISESIRALEAGAIDAFFWSGGVPTDAIKALSERTPVALVDLGGLTRPMRTRWGGVYERAAIPAGTYGLTAPVPTVTIPNYVVVGERTGAALAHDLTQLLFDARLVTDRDRAQRVIAPVGLHRGAQEYYAAPTP